MNVILYTAPRFPACDEARRYLTERGVEFKEINVIYDQEAWNAMVYRSNQHGVPVIAIGDRTVVGFDPGAIEQALAEERKAPVT